MRVLVTGGTGLVGKAVIARLAAHGWDVRVIGLEPEFSGPAGVAYARCDILDFAAVCEQVRGCTAVVHLAAIPNPRQAPGHDVFAVNAAGTFNVFAAAAQAGIRRVVQTSSINAIGCAWGTAEIAPRALPIDEEQPAYTTDPYSFSKQVVEDVGAYYWRRDGISSVALRLPAVLPAEWLEAEPYWQGRAQMRAFLDGFRALPADERAARLADVRQRALDYRGRRLMEQAAPADGAFPNLDDQLWRAYTLDRFNYWAFIDERDSAQAIERALLAEYEGAHLLFVNADHNWLGYDSAVLARLFFPDVPVAVGALVGPAALISSARARALIGFVPEYGTLPPG